MDCKCLGDKHGPTISPANPRTNLPTRYRRASTQRSFADRDVFEDREFEVVTEFDVDLDAQMSAIEAVLSRAPQVRLVGNGEPSGAWAPEFAFASCARLSSDRRPDAEFSARRTWVILVVSPKTLDHYPNRRFQCCFANLFALQHGLCLRAVELQTTFVRKRHK